MNIYQIQDDDQETWLIKAESFRDAVKKADRYFRQNHESLGKAKHYYETYVLESCVLVGELIEP